MDSMHSCLQLEDVLHCVVSLGGLWVLAPMRGVCRRWHHVLQGASSPDLEQAFDNTAEGLVKMLRHDVCHENCKRPCWPLGTRSDLSKLFALPMSKFMQLNVKRHSVPAYFSTEDALRRTLKHTGGLWALLARHHRRKRGLRLQPIAFDLDARRQQVTSAVANLLQTNGYDRKLTKRILRLVQYAS